MSVVRGECYSRCVTQGQTEEPARVIHRCPPQLLRIDRARLCNPADGVRDPRRLVPLSPKRNGREIRRIGFHEQSVRGNEPQKLEVRPFSERHDPAEGYVPPGRQRVLGQSVRAGVAVQNPAYTRFACVSEDASGVILRVAGVHDHRSSFFGGKGDLRRDRSKLRVARRVVVVIVEAAFTYRHRPLMEIAPQQRNVSRGIERGRIMRVDSRGVEHEALVVGGEPGRDLRGLERLTNADDRERARGTGARDYGVAVAGERRVREVGVAVDEDLREPVSRGHFRSIQSRTGAAT